MTDADKLALEIGRRTLRERIDATKSGSAARRIDEILYAPRGRGFLVMVHEHPAISEEGQKFLREVMHLLEAQAFAEVEESER